MKYNFIRDDVLFTYNIFSKYSILNFLSSGMSGSVFSCKDENDDDNKVIKLIPLDVNISNKYYKLGDIEDDEATITTTKAFLEQVKFSKQFSELNIGPKFFESGVFKAENIYQGEINIGYIVFSKLDITLFDYYKNENYKSEKEKIKEILLSKAKQLDELKLLHFDMNGTNIMLKLDKHEKVLDAYFIDFGPILDLKERMSNEKLLNCILKNISHNLY